MNISFVYTIAVLMTTLLLSAPTVNAQAVTEGKPAPDFSTTDIFGTPISLSGLKGKKVLLSFMRNAGCPVCNLRVHELRKNAGTFTAKNIEVVLIYESGASNLRKYVSDLDKAQFPFRFVADSTLTLYNQYGIEASFFKFMGSMFNGIMGKMDEGKKLFKSDIPQDGSMMRIPADVFIDENGIVRKAHYGGYVGDHLALKEIL
jgi:thioredoxin-dependent peroxiredoxin